MEKILQISKKIVPLNFQEKIKPCYHWSLAFLAAIIYRFPSRKIKVIGVTGTKGKSSTTEIINAILEEAGYTTALSNTIRFKVAETSMANLYKMSMPGRFFGQRFIRKAVSARCDFVILEMTSQGSLQYRHKFIQLDTFVFTNLSPEHIESHGSYENYIQAKINIACEIIKSKKPDRTIIVNGDDKASLRFLSCEADKKISYGLTDAEPYQLGNTNGKSREDGIDFTLSGKKVHSPLSGLFNLYNILAAIATAKNCGISNEIILRAIEKFDGIKGRVEKIEEGQDFSVVVDYAHTPDSLEKFYRIFKKSRNICVLGGTGGGRDAWKRKEMGGIADRYCDEIILTDEDPYDEDPKQIVADVAEGINDHVPVTIMDRREAIREAISRARTNDAVLITGKGTDPYIMGPNGTKTPWSDTDVAREELRKRV